MLFMLRLDPRGNGLAIVIEELTIVLHLLLLRWLLLLLFSVLNQLI